MSDMKITRHEHVKVDVAVNVAELVEKFTDSQLATVGLFRSLRDADIERENILRQQSWREAARCDDDCCECVLHEGRPSVSALLGNRVPAKQPDGSEAAFWHEIRNLLLRRDFNAVTREVEARAWNRGGVSILLAEPAKAA
ncbi:MULTISPECIES: hypothetical protein [unclassified Luteibacter]|uniref:hypothetical protein n=1 Tax=Luteibacter sp. PvP019 TaxID=3156436 RepID=UPI003397CB0C